MKRLSALALALVLVLTGCRGQGQPSPSATLAPGEHLDSNFFAMDTLMAFTVYGPHAREGLASAQERVEALDKLLSVTDEHSQVWQLNHADGAPVTVEEDLGQLLTASQSLWEATGGALNVTMYPVTRAWGFTTGNYRVPDREELHLLLERVNSAAVEVEHTGDTWQVTLPAGMELDFGAVAKGYAGELCADTLRELGVTSAILRLAGNIQTVGAKPDGSPWRIGIQDPKGQASDSAVILALTDQAAVTSGSYERYFEEDGVRYCHIMDPATGAPARSGLTSATIVADSGTLCDGLSTALFVMGREKALDYWRAHRDFECILMDEDDQIWITAGLADAVTPVDGTGYTLHIVEA